MNMTNEIVYDPIVRIKWVCEYLGVDQSTIFRWRYCKNSTFPEPLKLSSRSLGWRKSSIEKWLKDKEEQPVEDETEE